MSVWETNPPKIWKIHDSYIIIKTNFTCLIPLSSDTFTLEKCHGSAHSLHAAIILRHNLYTFFDDMVIFYIKQLIFTNLR